MTGAINRWPARVDLLQSLTGLALVLFVWAHMFFESSILLGKDAMLWVTHMFEGALFFDELYPQLVSIAGIAVFALIILHALFAMRRFPSSWRQHRALRDHMSSMQHTDTNLWYVQAVTGFALFFLASAHLIGVIIAPEDIGPYASSDRIWSGRFWLLYLPLLVVVHLHAGIGAYRLVMKWHPPTGRDAAVKRERLRRASWWIIGFFTLLGSVSLATYMWIGYGHADQVGERYRPAETAEH